MSSRRTNSHARRRAIRAARSVVLSSVGAAAMGAATVACGTTDEPTPPESSETSEATSTEETSTETPAVCSTESNGVCPEECTIHQDRDCCEAEGASDPYMECYFHVREETSSCGCAVEGPIPPLAVPL